MDTIILWTGIIMSLILFANKVLVLIGKKLGWLVGSIGTILAIIYLYLIHLNIMMAAEFGILIIMLYGYFAKEKASDKVEWLLRTMTFLILIFLSYNTFSGALTIIEFLTAVVFIIGAYNLTHEKIQSGWFLLLVGHLLMAYLAYGKNQTFFADFQVASAIVSGAGIMKKASLE